MTTPCTNADTLRSRMERFMSSNAMRATRERLAVVDTILSLGKPFDAAMLHEATESDSGLRVSRATVYNTLNLCLKAGIISRAAESGRHPLWEVVEPGSIRARLVCSRCGATRPTSLTDLSASLSARRFGRFLPTGFDIVINGICARCQRET